MSQKPKVAFICVHNSCRSQIAEALGKYLASDVFESYSAGTQTVPQINQDAVRLMKQLLNVALSQVRRRFRFGFHEIRVVCGVNCAVCAAAHCTERLRGAGRRAAGAFGFVKVCVAAVCTSVIVLAVFLYPFARRQMIIRV